MKYSTKKKQNLCECGCGNLCHTRFVSGHNPPWNRDKTGLKYKPYKKREGKHAQGYTMPEEERLKHKGTNQGSKNGQYGDKYLHSEQISCPECGKLVFKRGFGSHLLSHSDPISREKYGEIRRIGLKKYWIEIRGDIPSQSGYDEKFNFRLKEKIRDRDGRKCRGCGRNESEFYRRLDVHHFDGDKLNCFEDNLISLCISCHPEWNRRLKKKDENYGILRDCLNDVNFVNQLV